ncbi:MAG TPA: DNA translocase FtsK 4TM domain-containing protein, partial [Actinomycetota bacterium]|nr:DNA translocase FtsK 4TM domain-containing protein [Actinomycetota bacterium]
MAKARTRRPQTRRPAPARKRRPAATSTRTQRVGRSSSKALSPHKGDIQGVFLGLFAVLLVLGIWFEDGGKLGVFLALLFRNLFGYGAFAVPVLVAGLALALFWRPAAKDDMVAGRVTIGLLTLLLGGLGLLHLARGAPPPSARPPAILQESGGLVGAILATPLARLLSTWGAGALFACLLFLGTLSSTRTSVAAVGRGIASVGRLAGSALTAPPTPPPPPPSPPEVVEPVDSGEAPPK